MGKERGGEKKRGERRRIGDDGLERIWRLSARVEEWREDGREAWAYLRGVAGVD